jgi:glycerol-3-phosphate dehydrogenase
MAGASAEVAVAGGGVVGCAVAHALARCGVRSVLLEREPALALGASGTNSGILHTGFDSPPGELETRLILRAAQLREQLREELGYPLLACGARLAPAGPQERDAVERLAANASANGVSAPLEPTGALRVPGEAVTDPVAFVHALAGAARAGGAEILTGTAVSAIAVARRRLLVQLSDGAELRPRALINCAGLFADQLAALAGERPVGIHPRKGEFLVFPPPPQGPPGEILLPVPSSAGKGVLVFPTLDGHVIAGPTARDREDKEDWSVEEDAAALIRPRAEAMFPPLRSLTALGAYAGLRPAGDGANYVIERSQRVHGLVHVAAIRSTGLSASLAIGEHVVALLAETGLIEPGEPRPLPAAAPAPGGEPWWWRAAVHRELWPGPPAARRPA